MRNYHVKSKYLRPELERSAFWKSFWAAIQIIGACLLLLALYGWMGARDAEAHTSALLASYMTHGAVESQDTIYMCGKKTYEVPK